jgi:hypothetical protein
MQVQARSKKPGGCAGIRCRNLPRVRGRARAGAELGGCARECGGGDLPAFEGESVAKKEARAFDAIGEIVRYELERRDMTQAELASRAGIEPIAVRSWLSGRRGLRSDRVARVLKVLDLDISRRA